MSKVQYDSNTHGSAIDGLFLEITAEDETTKYAYKIGTKSSNTGIRIKPGAEYADIAAVDGTTTVRVTGAAFCASRSGQPAMVLPTQVTDLIN